MSGFEMDFGESSRLFGIGDVLFNTGCISIGLSADVAVLHGPPEGFLIGGGVLTAVGLACMLRASRVTYSPDDPAREPLSAGTLHVLPSPAPVEDSSFSDLRRAA